MGQPAVSGKGRFEKTPVDGVTVWRPAGVSPAPDGRSITIDLRGIFLFGKRLVVRQTS